MQRDQLRAPRNRYRERPSDERVLRIIGEHYEELRQRCRRFRVPDGVDFDDIFHDTIIEMACDPKVVPMTEREILEYFIGKFYYVNYQEAREQQSSYGIYTQTQVTQAGEIDPVAEEA